MSKNALGFDNGTSEQAKEVKLHLENVWYSWNR